jgi:hypothetical protein
MRRCLFFIVLFLAGGSAFAQKAGLQPEVPEPNPDSSAKWSFHFQLSIVNNWHGHYHFPYAGALSLDSNAESKLSMTSTLYIGRKLWRNAFVYFCPEITGGLGLSGTHGMAGFPNGEIYRVGNPTPTPLVSRLYFQQLFPLPGTSYEMREDGLNQLPGRIPSSRIAVSVGKFCVADFFDANVYNHDARTQFLNWSMMAAGAWDFPADTRGYTYGGTVELIKPKWAVRYSIVAVPETANGLDMDLNLARENGQTLEYERHYAIGSRPGTVRVDAFRNSSTAPRYRDALNEMAHGDSELLRAFTGDTAGPRFGQIKYGFSVNLEQNLADDLGAFLRCSWNDGKTAAWAFTDIDQSLQLGINMRGDRWKRPNDNFGIGGAINGISKDHRDFLAAGGTTFIIGDGRLNYGREMIFETYYRANLEKFLSVSLDYQLIINPAYNMDRKGPVHVPGVRVHVEF